MKIPIEELLDATFFKPKCINNPLSWVGHTPFAFWLVKKHKPSLIVELGTHTGNSYFSFCQSVLQEGLHTKCYAIDTWEGDLHSGKYSEIVYDEFVEYNNKNYKNISEPIRSKFDNALPLFEDNSIEMLHIDGLHTYEAVKKDFESWLPKLTRNAVILLHDTNEYKKDFGVWRLWQELRERFPNNIQFKHAHGLGVFQLNECDLERRIQLLDKNFDSRSEIIKFFEFLGNAIHNKYLVKLLELEKTEYLKIIKKLDFNFKKHDDELIRHQKIIYDLQIMLKSRL